MALLLAGLPVEVPGSTLNRLCGSGMDAVISAARGINTQDYRLAIAGGVGKYESAHLYYQSLKNLSVVQIAYLIRQLAGAS